jgi:hypothetical protein
MKEITMITTCEITYIEKVSDEDAVFAVNNKDAMVNGLCDLIKSELRADDANVLKNQIFIRDVPN